ncbi:MAG: glycine--tRNA ligase [Corynebacteriales bacterium]|nr:glycine--tRNA ligase [Mycobacteriales bacterium]
MQEALQTLTQYWTNHGAIVVQPMNTEVGAGTNNPATLLRVLGPEPWNVAYTEPSVRPDDARYGENPNRLQMHTQFQVILKPDPGNPQELYLGSLAALGIDTNANDVRFVEDNWASPAIGAWGLGWEVWLNGLEITQFTYFQQAGGITLDPVSVEITYGMERIIMALQNVDHFAKIEYAPGVSYGEVFGQSEYEMSRYYLDDADITTNRTLFDAYESEARRLIDARLPVPAYSYVLKCSHTFNVLDSRGAISTTERARAFARMRTLAHEVAELWAARREELELPLGTVDAPVAVPAEVDGEAPEAPASLLFEIGTEELPPHEVTKSADAVRHALITKLDETRLPYGDIHVTATPRRIVALVHHIAPQEPDHEATSKGPRVSAAFDDQGAPTKAALGFARGQGVDVAELERMDVNGVEHVSITKIITGRPAMEVLSEILPRIVSGLRSDKNMRWNAPGLTFTRPIRWIVALLDDAVVPFTVSSLTSGRRTRVHRTAENPEVVITRAEGYETLLASHGIIIDSVARRMTIMDRGQELAATVNGVLDISGETQLIDEITNLVEEPNPILVSFDEGYLRLPAEILTTVMRKHQRYLPVRSATGQLLPHVIAVANGSHHDEDLVRNGNAAVLRARYEDAAFFYDADLQQRPETFLPVLDRLTFADKLGSMGERAARIRGLARHYANLVVLDADDQATVQRAGELAKFDLGTKMVTELTSLAGTMASEYALRAGESPAVATALAEMELPRATGGALPQTTPGALLALADRFDLLVGLFAIGAVPTGSSDPFAMRRAALGVVTILRTHPRLASITVPEALRLAATGQPVDVPQSAIEDAAEFITRRFAQQLLDSDVSHNHVQALEPLMSAPARVDATMVQLAGYVEDESFEGLAAALQRVRRIVPADTKPLYDAATLVEPSELRLHAVFGEVKSTVGTEPTLREFVEKATPLTDPINTFFDDVLVMAEDPSLRAARLGLLASIAALSAEVLDWSAL